MAHLSENVIPLPLRNITTSIRHFKPTKGSVELIILPYYQSLFEIQDKKLLYKDLKEFIESTDDEATIAILTSPIVAADFCSEYEDTAHLKLWVPIKLEKPIKENGKLDSEHAALLILTKYAHSLEHTKTRIGYT